MALPRQIASKLGNGNDVFNACAHVIVLVLWTGLARDVTISGMSVKWAGKTIESSGFKNALQSRIAVPQVQAYRKGWKETFNLTLSAYAGMYPEQFDVELDISKPGVLVGPKITAVRFHDTHPSVPKSRRAA